jgi:hypothetical protein
VVLNKDPCIRQQREAFRLSSTPVATAQCKEAFDALTAFMRDMRPTDPERPGTLPQSFYTKRRRDLIEFAYEDSGKTTRTRAVIGRPPLRLKPSRMMGHTAVFAGAKEPASRGRCGIGSSTRVRVRLSGGGPMVSALIP